MRRSRWRFKKSTSPSATWRMTPWKWCLAKAVGRLKIFHMHIANAYELPGADQRPAKVAGHLQTVSKTSDFEAIPAWFQMWVGMWMCSVEMWGDAMCWRCLMIPYIYIYNCKIVYIYIYIHIYIYTYIYIYTHIYIYTYIYIYLYIFVGKGVWWLDALVGSGSMPRCCFRNPHRVRHGRLFKNKLDDGATKSWMAQGRWLHVGIQTFQILPSNRYRGGILHPNLLGIWTEEHEKWQRPSTQYIYM